MAKPLNFNNAKKHYLSVTLADEKNTILLVGTPTKSIMNDLVALQSDIEAINADNTDVDSLDDLYEACARILSHNKAGVKISTEYLSDIFDVEDIIIFFTAYMDFMDEIINSKN